MKTNKQVNPITIIVLGDIAAGKGTQAKLLAEKYGLKHLDMGEYSRSLVKKGVDGAKNRVEKGILTKSDLIQDYILKELQSLKSDHGVIIDGGKMPEEAQLVYDLLKGQDRKILAIYLTVPKKESMKRLKSRQREDDDPKAIQNRIDYYENIYSQTIKFWEDLDLLERVDGNKSVDEVQQDLVNIIEQEYGTDQN